MPPLATPPLQKRWSGPQKTCPDCGETVPGRLSFCPNCGRELQSVPENIRSSTDPRTQFQLPGYLLAAPEGRRYDEARAGTGIIWLGLALLAIPVVTRNLSPLALGAWLVGAGLTGAGIIRTRTDGPALLRAGALTAAAGLLTLVLIGQQVLRQPASAPQVMSTIADTAPATSTEPASSNGQNAAMLTGSIPMLRGAPEHSGVLPGPALDGNPYRAWRYDSGGELRSAPAISGGIAYFGTRNGYLIAIDLLTHSKKWSFDLGGYPVRSSPALADRTVYVASGFNLFAVDAERGEQRWKFAIDYAGESSPTIADGVVYIASKRNQLYAIDAATGEQRWSFKTKGLLFGSPSVAGDLVIVGGDDGSLVAVDRTNGHLVWKFDAGSGIYSTPAVADGQVFVTTHDQTTFALELTSGRELWSVPVGGSSSPAIADGVVYVGSTDGALYAIDAAKGGEPRWLFATGSTNVGSPVVAGDQVMFSTGTSIIALNRKNGAVVWQYPVGEEITTELVVVDAMLFAGDEHGSFVAIAGDASLSTPSSSG